MKWSVDKLKYSIYTISKKSGEFLPEMETEKLGASNRPFFLT